MTSHPQAREPARRQRGQNAGTPARQAQIIRAALESFAQHGYAKASLRDIAARAEVTHAGILRHFSGKDELLLAALAQREADEEALADRIIQAGARRESILSEVLRDEFGSPDYQRNWMALAIAATDSSHPAHEFFVTRRERMRTRFSGSPLPTSRDSAYLSADEKVTLVLALIDGLRIQSLLDPSRETLRLLEVFMTLVITPTEDDVET
ncbi:MULTISPECIES: TetR/AcrR family transcriptional regulator [Nocardia]|uniref:TetR/AcrR family transcriptional regulator n=1 Tax=Nocardia TaxID=1817 RepID=UPI000D696518|nr:MULTISPECIES: TetR/AcrR family transcriptional regulator [Nocardia]